MSAVMNNNTFLTERVDKINETRKEIAELEALLSGATQTSQSTLLLKKRKEMREIDEALELMKETYKNRTNACEERRHLFELKQAKLREQVAKFEKFIQENDAKRQRAEMKAKQEKKLYDQKVQELSMLAEKIEQLEKDQRELEHQLDIKNRFRSYLERVIEVGDHGYEEISDLLNRHKTLLDANNDLMKQVQEQDIEIDICRQKLHALKMETQNQLLVGNSQIQIRQKELEKVFAAVKHEEAEKNLKEEDKKAVVRESGQVVQAIRNIFARCESSMRIKPQQTASRDDGLSELLAFNLDVIHARILDLKEICEEYKISDKTAADKDSANTTRPMTEASGANEATGRMSEFASSGPSASTTNKGGVNANRSVASSSANKSFSDTSK